MFQVKGTACGKAVDPERERKPGKGFLEEMIDGVLKEVSKQEEGEYLQSEEE